MLGKERVREIARNYAAEVRKILTPAQVILFGSYVNGKPHEWSDIDIAVLVDNVADKDWYDSRILLQRIRHGNNRNFDEFDDVEPHLLDVNHDPSGFVKHVINTGEVVYQCQHRKDTVL